MLKMMGDDRQRQAFANVWPWAWLGFNFGVLVLLLISAFSPFISVHVAMNVAESMGYIP